MEYLQKCYEEHSHWLIYLHLDPSMDALRDNPQFRKTSCGVLGLPALPAAIPNLTGAKAEDAKCRVAFSPVPGASGKDPLLRKSPVARRGETTAALRKVPGPSGE